MLARLVLFLSVYLPLLRILFILSVSITLYRSRFFAADISPPSFPVIVGWMLLLFGLLLLVRNSLLVPGT